MRNWLVIIRNNHNDQVVKHLVNARSRGAAYYNTQICLKKGCWVESIEEV
jgi:hypothetical protein